jgi:membrane fusion protein, multidrug efflux system
MSPFMHKPLMRTAAMTIAVFMGLILAGCEKKPIVVAPPTKVTVAKPVTQDVRSYEIFDGVISPLLTVNLEARVPGYLNKIAFQDGAFVKKDDLLFVIEQDQYIQQVNLTEAIYNEAKIELARQRALVKDKATSQASVDKAFSSFLQSEANLKLAQLNLSYTEIRAPFDGLMGRHLIDVGNYLGSSASGIKLATIQKINPIYVYFYINERDLLKYQKRYVNEDNRKSLVNSLPVYVQLQGEKGFAHKGTLDYAANLLSTSTGSLQLRAELPNDKLNLLPGLYGKVLAEYGELRKSVLIPARTVQTDQQGDYVFVMDDNKKVERRAIKTGQRFDSLIEIAQGLKDSETFVLNGFINISNGQTVNPEMATVAPIPAR